MHTFTVNFDGSFVFFLGVFLLRYNIYHQNECHSFALIKTFFTIYRVLFTHLNLQMLFHIVSLIEVCK